MIIKCSAISTLREECCPKCQFIWNHRNAQWYYCPNHKHPDKLQDRFVSGEPIIFYFDDTPDAYGTKDCDFMLIKGIPGFYSNKINQRGLDYVGTDIYYYSAMGFSEALDELGKKVNL